jgi:hypothetical protein
MTTESPAQPAKRDQIRRVEYHESMIRTETDAIDRSILVIRSALFVFIRVTSRRSFEKSLKLHTFRRGHAVGT